MRWSVLPAVLVSLVLAGCGSSSTPSNGEASRSAIQILADARAAIERVSSLRAEGTMSIAQRPARVTIAFKQPGKISATFAQTAGSVAAVVVVGGTLYLRASSGFYRQQGSPAAVAGLLADRWVKVPASAVGGASQLTSGLSLSDLSRCLVENRGTLSVAGRAMVAGKSAVVVVDKGDLPGSTPGRLYIAATGAPLLLREIATGPQRPGGRRDPLCNDSSDPTRAGDELTFSAYNQPVTITAPRDAVDLSQLTGR